jgi:hypothetical protein
LIIARLDLAFDEAGAARGFQSSADSRAGLGERARH